MIEKKIETLKQRVGVSSENKLASSVDSRCYSYLQSETVMFERNTNKFAEDMGAGAWQHRNGFHTLILHQKSMKEI